MRKHEIHNQDPQEIGTCGLYPNDVAPVTMYGINGWGEHITGIVVHDKEFQRAGGESVDAFTFRVAREVAQGLPAEAKRDHLARPIGHYVYDGLPADHCRKY